MTTHSLAVHAVFAQDDHRRRRAPGPRWRRPSVVVLDDPARGRVPHPRRRRRRRPHLRRPAPPGPRLPQHARAVRLRRQPAQGRCAQHRADRRARRRRSSRPAESWPAAPSRRPAPRVSRPRATTRQPLRRNSSRAIARPRPVPPLSRSRASSSRVNRSKTRSRSASRDAVAVVGHGDPAGGRATVAPRPHAAAARAGPRCRRGWSAARYRSSYDACTDGGPVRDAARRTGTRAAAYRAADVRQRRPTDVDDSRRRGWPPASSARARSSRSSTSADSRPTSGEQVVRQPAALAESLGDLELGPHRRQRAAQLVGGVGDEGALGPPAAATRSSISLRVVASACDLVAGSAAPAAARRWTTPSIRSRRCAAPRPAQGRADDAPGDRAHRTSSSRGKTTSRRPRSVLAGRLEVRRRQGGDDGDAGRARPGLRRAPT